MAHSRRRIIMDYVLVPVLSSRRASPLPSLDPPSSIRPPSPPIPQPFYPSPPILGTSPVGTAVNEPAHSPAPHSWWRQPSEEEEGGDYDDSDFDQGSEDERGCSSSASPPAPLQGKRPRRNFHQPPSVKKICMHAPKGSSGYPAKTCDLPTGPSKASVGSVPYCSETSHVDSSKGCPSTPLTHCVILYKVGMYFGPYGFVCEKCGLIYPPGYLRHHIVNKHSDDLDITITGKPRKEVYDLIVAHLLAAHGVPENVIAFDLPETISIPIRGLTPILSYQCSVCPQPRWFSWNSLRYHYRDRHEVKKPSKQSLCPRFIIRPYRLGNREGRGGRHELSDVVILLPEGWTPTDADALPPLREAISRNQPLLPEGAPHLVAIGWSGYLQGLKDVDVNSLMKLVQLPREKELESFLPRRAALERGLLHVDTMLVRYLEDANTFLDSCHPSVRKAITSGTKAHYRHLTRRSYLHYRVVMTKTLGLLLRVHHFSRLKDKSDLKRLGSFSVVCNEHQASAIRLLYDHLVSADNKDKGFIPHTIVLVHKLLVSLVHHEIHGTRRMECPTDQSLFLLSLRLSPQGVLQFQTANQLTRDCAALQYWFLTIVVHIARLEACAEEEFLFFSSEDQNPLSLYELDMLSPLEASTTDHGKEDGLLLPKDLSDELEATGALVAEEEEEETEDGIEMDGDGENNIGDGSATNILRVIHREKEKWLRKTPGDYSTAYDRFKSVWYDTAPTAFKESGKIGHAFQPDGTTIIIDAAGNGHRINLVDIGKEARRILLEIEALVYQCLPEGTKDAFTSFPDLSHLSDDLNDPSSIFLQGGNRTLLEPIVDTVGSTILQSFSNEKDMHSWLQHNDHLLSLFLVAIALTCGIPPRGFQFGSLQFSRCSKSGNGRGVFLIDGCLVIGKPAAKQSGRTRQDSLWLLPPTLASFLSFYLAVLRPIVVKVLAQLRKCVDHQDAYIFCRTIPRTNGTYSWNGDEITRMVQCHTKNLKITLSIPLLRQLYTAFFRQYFPGLCDAGVEEDSLVDRQGQHRFYTGQRHYGQLMGNVPRSLGIDITEARKLSAMSQLLQIVLKLRVPDEHWRPLLEAAHFLPHSKYDRYAQDTARLHVLYEYGILTHGMGPAAALRARKILADRPYLTLPMESGDKFGDTVLVRVLNAYLFGEAGPQQYDQTPPGGYPVADVARGVILIILAVEEWTHGDHWPVIPESDLKAEKNFNDLQRHAEKILGDASENWPDEWNEFCKAIRTHRPKTFKRDWSMDGLPRSELDGLDQA